MLEAIDEVLRRALTIENNKTHTSVVIPTEGELDRTWMTFKYDTYTQEHTVTRDQMETMVDTMWMWYRKAKELDKAPDSEWYLDQVKKAREQRNDYHKKLIDTRHSLRNLIERIT